MAKRQSAHGDVHRREKRKLKAFDLDGFASIVAPELNFLLTEPPFEFQNSLDWGLFCREHAYCTRLLAATKGLDLEIVRGHLAVIDAEAGLSSYGESSDHAWCMLGPDVVIDLSLNLMHYQHLSQIGRPVSSTGINGPYSIEILDTERFEQATQTRTGVIAYLPERVIDASIPELLANPCVLVTGQEAAVIVLVLTLHIALMLKGDRSPVDRTMKGGDALDAIIRELGADDPRIRLNKILGL